MRGIQEPGKADWIYDDYFNMHIPCCTKLVLKNEFASVHTKCGNGPLTGLAIFTGDCGEH